jgi:endoglucanase
MKLLLRLTTILSVTFLAAATSASPTVPASGTKPTTTTTSSGLTTAPAVLLPGPHLTWTSEQGAILLNKHQFHMKGLNWFGMETADTRAPHGLWTTKLDDVLDFLAHNRFNVLRLPLSYAVARDLDLAVPSSAVAADASLGGGLTVGKLLEEIFTRCADRGIMVVLALRNEDGPATDGPGGNGLWYGSSTSYKDFQDAWRNLLTRFGEKWNFLGADLLNRPGHGQAKWGVDDPSHDWNLAAQDTAARLSDEFPQYRGLWFIQGIEGGQFAANFATDLRGALDHPIDLFTPANNARVVYEIVLMGPSACPSMSYQYATSFPENMYSSYDGLFGGIKKATSRAVVVGKWGGTMKDADQGDAIWQRTVADYLVSRCLDDTIYFTLNPNSKTTGGIFHNDWRTPNKDKLALLSKVQPNPSLLLKHVAGNMRGTVGNDRPGWSFVQGNAANEACNVAVK